MTKDINDMGLEPLLSVRVGSLWIDCLSWHEDTGRFKFPPNITFTAYDLIRFARAVIAVADDTPGTMQRDLASQSYQSENLTLDDLRERYPNADLRLFPAGNGLFIPAIYSTCDRSAPAMPKARAIEWLRKTLEENA